jgi:hypothetical protein
LRVAQAGSARAARPPQLSSSCPSSSCSSHCARAASLAQRAVVSSLFTFSSSADWRHTHKFLAGPVFSDEPHRDDSSSPAIISRNPEASASSAVGPLPAAAASTSLPVLVFTQTPPCAPPPRTLRNLAPQQGWLRLPRDAPAAIHTFQGLHWPPCQSPPSTAWFFFPLPRSNGSTCLLL